MVDLLGPRRSAPAPSRLVAVHDECFADGAVALLPEDLERGDPHVGRFTAADPALGVELHENLFVPPGGRRCHREIVIQKRPQWSR